MYDCCVPPQAHGPGHLYNSWLHLIHLLLFPSVAQIRHLHGWFQSRNLHHCTIEILYQLPCRSHHLSCWIKNVRSGTWSADQWLLKMAYHWHTQCQCINQFWNYFQWSPLGSLFHHLSQSCSWAWLTFLLMLICQVHMSSLLCLHPPVSPDNSECYSCVAVPSGSSPSAHPRYDINSLLLSPFRFGVA